MEKDKKNSLFCVFFIFFFDNFGVSIVYPLFGPLILQSQYHLLLDEPLAEKNILLGLLLASFPLAQFFSCPIIGDFADYVGRRKVFFFTTIGTTIGYILSALALDMQSYSFLLISRLLTGFCAGNLSICLATVADLSTSEKKRAKNFALISTTGGLSWIIAILVGGYLSNSEIVSFFKPSFPFWVTAFFSLLSVLIIYFIFKETHQSKIKKVSFNFFKGIHHILEAIKIKKLRLLFFVLLFWMLGWVIAIQWYSGFSVENYQATQKQIVSVFIILGIIWGVSSSFLNRYLINHLQIKQILIIGFIGLSLSFFLSAIESNFLYFSIFYLIGTGFGALCWSNTFNLISISASVGIQGKVMGIAQSMLALSQFLGPFTGGILANLGLKSIYFSAASFVLLALLLLLIWGLTESESKKIRA